jgi:pimeloyl-ACP methyl ester carboxylesterase
MNLSTEEKYIQFLQAKYEKEADEKYYIMSDGTQLKVLYTKAPKETNTGYKLLFAPGWGSVVQGWDDVLIEAMKYFDIYYFESREKGSCILTKKTKNDLDRLSSDVKELIEQLKLKKEELIIFSSSFGSLYVTDGLAKNKYEAFLTVLIGATPTVDLPRFTKYLVPWIPPFVLKIYKPFAKYWIKKSKTEDPEQAAKYIRVLEEADGKKWQSVAKHFVFSWYWDVYEKAEDRVLIIGMEKDKFHEIEHIKKIEGLMKNSIYVDLETNKKAHSATMVEVLIEEIKKLE